MNDFLFSRKQYTIAAVHTVILVFLLIFDGTLYRGFHAWLEWAARDNFFLLKELTRHRHWEFFREFGNIWAAVVIFAFLYEYDREKRKYIYLFFIAVAVSTLCYMLVQHAVGKLRPSVADGAVTYLPFLQGFYVSKNLSFPSGHTTFAFCLATFLSFLYPKKRVLFYTVAAACGVSRVVFRAHFFSEVYAGALLGYTVVSAVVYLRCRLSNKTAARSVPPGRNAESFPYAEPYRQKGFET